MLYNFNNTTFERIKTSKDPQRAINDYLHKKFEEKKPLEPQVLSAGIIKGVKKSDGINNIFNKWIVLGRSEQ